MAAIAVAAAPEAERIGTVSIAGPSARVADRRIRELAPLVMQCASELSSLWPLRPKTLAPYVARSAAKAA